MILKYLAPLITCFSFLLLLHGTAFSMHKQPTMDHWGKKYFTLFDTSGKEVSLKKFEGFVVLLFFGHANSPDISPLSLVKIRKTLQILGKQADQVQVLFITLDPARDSATILKDYLNFIDKRIIGLRGSKAQIHVIAKEYGTRFRKRKIESKREYVLDQTAFIYLINQDSRITSVFRFSSTAKEIAQKIQDLL